MSLGVSTLFVTMVPVLTSQPLVATPSQVVKPSAQKKAHVEAAQGEVALARVNAEKVKRREHAPAGFGKGRTFDKQVVPDPFGLLGFGPAPEGVRRFAGAAEGFGNQVMISQKVVDSPGYQRSKGGVKKVRVDVKHGSVFNHFVDNLAKSRVAFSAHPTREETQGLGKEALFHRMQKKRSLTVSFQRRSR
jgi:hypothetical protein